MKTVGTFIFYLPKVKKEKSVITERFDFKKLFHPAFHYYQLH